MRLNHTVNLSISHKDIDPKCEKVIELLRSNNIMGSSVVVNTSIQCDSNTCWLENGCRITIGTKNIDPILKEVWEPLQKKFNLQCGHISIESGFSGCVWDFFRDSNCPGTKC